MSRPLPNRTIRISRFAAALLGAGALLGIAAAGVGILPAPAHAHDELIGREVVVDEEGAPESIRLSFNNSIMDVGTEVRVTSADGADATDGLPQVAGPDVILPLTPDLAPGEYAGAWRVVSSDGHPIEGAFALVVASDGSATLEDAVIGGGADEQSDSETDASETDAGSGALVGALIAVGGVIVVVGAVVAATVGRKRRARGMAADAEHQQDR